MRLRLASQTPGTTRGTNTKFTEVPCMHQQSLPDPAADEEEEPDDYDYDDEERERSSSSGDRRGTPYSSPARRPSLTPPFQIFTILSFLIITIISFKYTF